MFSIALMKRPSRPPLLCGMSLGARPNGLHRTAAALLMAVAVVLCARPAKADEATEIRALIAQGDLNAALARSDKAVAANPRDPQTRFLNGVVLMDMRRDDDAMALFTRLAQEYPELPDPYNNMALLQARAGRLELARQSLETALRNDPSHPSARANLGQVYLMLAVRAWEQAAATAPMDQPLQRKLVAARALLATPALPAR
jgi:Flp pilus assembly protein TadD